MYNHKVTVFMNFFLLDSIVKNFGSKYNYMVGVDAYYKIYLLSCNNYMKTYFRSIK